MGYCQFYKIISQNLKKQEVRITKRGGGAHEVCRPGCHSLHGGPPEVTSEVAEILFGISVCSDELHEL